jgi:hypothetical protein
MSDTKMSGERSEAFWAWYADRNNGLPSDHRLHGIDGEIVWKAAQAAAIEERDELVEALADALEAWNGCVINPHRPVPYAGLDLLVRHGRVIRDGETYKWSDRR